MGVNWFLISVFPNQTINTGDNHWSPTVPCCGPPCGCFPPNMPQIQSILPMAQWRMTSPLGMQRLLLEKRGVMRSKWPRQQSVCVNECVKWGNRSNMNERLGFTCKRAHRSPTSKIRNLFVFSFIWYYFKAQSLTVVILQCHIQTARSHAVIMFM